MTEAMRIDECHPTAAAAEEMLDAALHAIRQGTGLGTLLDRLPAPVYMTDAEGRITFYNRACVGFAGRSPALGQDRWCVTWKLYRNDGTSLPHDQCPMAVAIKEARRVRGDGAVAERPDGSRVSFLAYPTPLLDEAGVVTGAVNLLIDVTDRKQSDHLNAQARQCRRLAGSVTDRRTVDILNAMAAEYEDRARALQRPD